MNKTEYLLTCIMEECSEVQKECSKALRFGLEDDYTNTLVKNKIVSEYIDLLAVMELAFENTELPMCTDVDLVKRLIKLKKDKVESFMEYSMQKGTLDIE